MSDFLHSIAQKLKIVPTPKKTLVLQQLDEPTMALAYQVLTWGKRYQTGESAFAVLREKCRRYTIRAPAHYVHILAPRELWLRKIPQDNRYSLIRLEPVLAAFLHAEAMSQINGR